MADSLYDSIEYLSSIEQQTEKDFGGFVKKLDLAQTNYNNQLKLLADAQENLAKATEKNMRAAEKELKKQQEILKNKENILHRAEKNAVEEKAKLDTIRNQLSELKKHEEAQEKIKKLLEDQEAIHEKISEIEEEKAKLNLNEKKDLSEKLYDFTKMLTLRTSVTKEIDKQNDKRKKDIELSKEKINLLKEEEKNLISQGKNSEANRLKDQREKLESDLKIQQKQVDSMNTISTALKTIGSSIGKLFTTIEARIDSGITTYATYAGIIDARLQTSTKTSGIYKNIMDGYTEAFGASSFVSQKEILEALNTLTSDGINYNVEERAFLQSVSDKIVNSFNAANETMLRMIRLQQNDITSIMLGGESILTQYFNDRYKDTSYLNGVDDSVLSALTESMSVMDSNIASEYALTIQKWLGSMYSVGVSQNAVTGLASVFDSLGSGSASALESSSLGTLVNMAVARSGYSIADILTEGLSIDATNDILKSIIELVKDIKDNTSNQVTLSAYGNVLGLTMSDIRGMVNLTKDADSIYNTTISSKKAKSAVKDQLGYLTDRLTMGQQIENVIDNLGTTLGSVISYNKDLYSAYKLGDYAAEAGSSFGGEIGEVIVALGKGTKVATVAEALSNIGGSSLSGRMGKSIFDSNILKALVPGIEFVDLIKDVSGVVRGGGTLLGSSFSKNKLSSYQLNESPLIGNDSQYGINPEKYAIMYAAGLTQLAGRQGLYSTITPTYGKVTTGTSSSTSIDISNAIESSYTSNSDLNKGVNVSASFGNSSGTLTTLAKEQYAAAVESGESYDEYAGTFETFAKELLEIQNHPIKVHLAYFDDQALKQFKTDLHMDEDNKNISGLYNLATGSGIRSDVIESDISALVAAVRG